MLNIAFKTAVFSVGIVGTKLGRDKFIDEFKQALTKRIRIFFTETWQIEKQLDVGLHTDIICRLNEKL